MNKQIRREQDNLTNSHWKGMTSSIQPISNHRFSDSAYVVYNNQTAAVPRHSQAHSESRARNEPRGEPRRDSKDRDNKDRGKHKDLYAVPQRSYSDTAPPRENGTMFNTLGRSRNRKDDDVQRTATLGRYDNAPRYHDERAPPPPPQRQPRHFEDDPRNRETAFPPRDVYFDKVTRSRDDVYDSHSHSSQSSKGSRRYATLQPSQVQDYRRYSEQEENKIQRNTVREAKMNGSSKVPEDLYKAVQQRTPNEHIFVEYGKEVKRVVTPPLPIPLDQLRQKIIATFGDALTADMVPLKALYIQDSQTKIFYQLDDHSDVIKGSHLKLHEELVIKNIDRGSSQSLEDLNNSSNSSLSSGGGFVIPATPVSLPTKPTKRPGKSRLSLVEERLSMITHEINTIHKSDTCSEVSSQTDLPAIIPDTKPTLSHLHSIIKTLYHNLQETKSELMLLKRRELESKAEMDEIIKSTAEEITRQIQAAMPKGIRGQRMEADKVEAEYRQISEETYSNIKDLERTVDVLKTDVVKRKVRLDPVQLESMEKELQSYSQNVTHMNTTFDTLKESLKKVMKEELEIIVNEEQFLEDEEPMLEDVTVKCEELERVVETLKKVAAMQQEQGSNPLAIYTSSEYDIMEERHGVMQAIAALVPNHDERILSIQATEEIRAVQKKFQKSDSDYVVEEIQFKSQNLRKTNAFEELEKKREEALKAMYSAQPPPHKFGRKSSQPAQFNSSTLERKMSISKCKSMSSIANNEEDSRNFNYSNTDSDNESSPQVTHLSSQSAVNMKRSQSFTKDKDKHHSSEDEKTKKKTVFGFFSKKSKSNSKHDDSKQKDNHSADHNVESNGDVFVVDTANSPPSPAIIPRSYTEGSRKSLPKSRSKTDRTLSVNFDDKSSRNKKGKSRS
ncbi:uncharacterized protein LOC134825935 isoform X3 [Bolinopsis microptera]|uniref:uncharacterized protein LOC134825935 isoform X3 n=1 Tax=Bolinopsis microptera TaxID=2820187 RepID=UPI003078B3EB